MGQLNNLYVSSSYQGLLKMTDSATGITNTLQTIQTGDGTNSPLQMSRTEILISGSFYQTGTFYADQIDVSRGGIVNNTGSYVATFSNDGVLQYATYPEVVIALGQYASSGTSGTSGSNGSSGTSGNSGSSGSSGTAGTSGSSGSNGSSGTSGSNGSSGTSGATGSSGTSGTSGSNGSSGTSGATGTSGSDGSSGTSGTAGSSGSSGTSGVSGSSGTSGTSGSNGSSGTSGTAGTSGDSIFAQTGSFWNTTNNIGITGSLIVSGALSNTGSLVNVGNTYLFSPSFNSGTVKLNITGSGEVSQSNLIFGNTAGAALANQTGSFQLTGSNNIILQGTRTNTLAVGTYGYINGINNIVAQIPTLSTSSLEPVTINNNQLQNSLIIDITTGSGLYNISSNLLYSATTLRHKSGSISMTNNLMQGAVNSFASRSFIDANIGGTPIISANILQGQPINLLHTSSSINLTRNIINSSTTTFNNQFTNPTNYVTQGSGSLTIQNNIFGGSGNTVLSSGSALTDRTISNNIIVGTNNIVNQIASGSANTYVSNVALIGQNLIVSGSQTAAGATGGATIVGRFNATGSLQESSNDAVFVVGTGTGATARRNALHIDNANNTRITGSVTISGSLQVNGVSPLLGTTGLITTGSNWGGNQSITGSITISGSQALIVEAGDLIVRSGSIISKGSGDVINNMAIGDDALFSNQNVVGGGYNNTAIGYNALYYNTTGATNTAIGANAMLENVSGSSNVAIGDNALRNSKSNGNVAIGSTTLFQQTTGQANVAIGGNALQNNVSGSNNVAIGASALNQNASNQNTAIGNTALQFNTIGDSNTAIGYQALNTNTIGNGNLAIGAQSLTANATGSRNVAIGNGALYYNVNDDNTAIGVNALTNNYGGRYNIGIGTDASYENTSGESNIAIGYIADRNRSEGVGNIAIGQQTLWSLGSGSYNIAIGNNAGYNIGNDDKQFYVAHKDFGSLNGDRSGSLMWGQMADAVSGQTLQVNGSLTVNPSSSFYAYGHKQFNVGGFQTNITQSGSANVSQSVNFEVTDISYGVSITSGSRLTYDNAGVYSTTFSAQLKAPTGADTVHMWLKKNGTNVAESATKMPLANNEEDVMTVNYLNQLNAGDYLEVAWQSTNGHAQLWSTGSVGNIPEIPSVIITSTQVR